MSFEMALKGLNAFKQVLMDFSNYKKGTKEEKRAALSAILEAATKTRKYIYDTKNGAPEDREAEGLLSQLWWQASVMLGDISPELAESCAVKAECWASPELWENERFKDIPVTLDYIFDESRRLITNSEKP